MINTMEVPPEELPGLDLFQNCRLCLAKEKVSVDIFSEGHEVRVLYYKIMSCLPVHVTQDDKLPRKICTQCNEKVDNFYQFWTLTAKTQKTLLDWSEKKDAVPAIKIKTENVPPPGEVSFKQETMDYSDDDNDRYDDDQSEDDLEPTAMVKVCEETDENAAGGAGGAAGTSAAPTVKLSLESDVETNIMVENNKEKDKITEDSLISSICGLKAKKKHKCDECNRCFTSKRPFEKHKLGHGEEYTCFFCGRSFKEKYRLRKHIITHSRNTSFTCEKCSICFNRKYELAEHEHIIHGGKKHNVYKAYKCTVCSKAFTHKIGLEDHQYVHTGQKSHVCHICPSRFASRRGLEMHIKVAHEGYKRLRPYENIQCELCGKKFSQRHHYNRHKRHIHGDGKPKCPVCGKIVSSKDFLAVHMNMHTGESPYKCCICLKAFKQRSSLTGHYKTNHPGEEPPRKERKLS
uniref:Zinc finger protein 585A n=2 Tax=Cacopsylla melanoneura TaxID=428564 RepID=A0A8D8U0F8_9HEMI